MARGLDHLVLAVHDLDAAGRFYERLGFQVGTRNRHPWGTENRLVQFPGSFIELISAGEGTEIPPHEPRSFRLMRALITSRDLAAKERPV